MPYQQTIRFNLGTIFSNGAPSTDCSFTGGSSITSLSADFGSIDLDKLFETVALISLND